MAQQSTSGALGSTYSERLIVPWWWWPITLGLAALFATEVFMGASTRLAWVPYAVLLAAAIGGLGALSRIRIEVRDGVLHVDDAQIPVALLTVINILDAAAKREVLGPLSEPLAFVVQRPWVSDALRLVVDDPADPTPYWVVSTRHPERLASAIVAARQGVATAA